MNTTVVRERLLPGQADPGRQVKWWMVWLMSAAFLGCSSTPLEDYSPRSPQEKAVHAVLVRYQEARKNFDLKRLLDCLHEHGAFAVETGQPVSKTVMGKMLARLWTGIRTGDPSVFPLDRECVNGNHFAGGKFVNPRIRFSTRDSAQAVLTFSVGWWHLGHHIGLIRENSQWWINRLDWETH